MDYYEALDRSNYINMFDNVSEVKGCTIFRFLIFYHQDID